jgi:hypothetical protein
MYISIKFYEHKNFPIHIQKKSYVQHTYTMQLNYLKPKNNILNQVNKKFNENKKNLGWRWKNL